MSQTVPNVVIQNPKARRIARTVLDIVGILLGLLIIVERTTVGLDFGDLTMTLMACWMFLRAAFGLGVDNPNTPKVGKYGDYSEVSR